MTQRKWPFWIIIFLQSPHGLLQFWTVWLPEHVTCAHLVQVQHFRPFPPVGILPRNLPYAFLKFWLTLRATQMLRRTLIAKLCSLCCTFVICSNLATYQGTKVHFEFLVICRKKLTVACSYPNLEEITNGMGYMAFAIPAQECLCVRSRKNTRRADKIPGC